MACSPRWAWLSSSSSASTARSARPAGMGARQLDALNAERRELEARVLAQAIDQVESGEGNAPLVFATGEGWHPGVIGIVASRLKERYNRPACVVALADGIGKGSGRSVPGLALGPAVIAPRQPGLLLTAADPAMAAGFTLRP